MFRKQKQADLSKSTIGGEEKAHLFLHLGQQLQLRCPEGRCGTELLRGFSLCSLKTYLKGHTVGIVYQSLLLRAAYFPGTQMATTL